MRDAEDRLRRLEERVGDLSSDLRTLRALVEQDHASALNKIRYVTEKVLHRLCRDHDVSWGTGEPTLENMIGPLIARRVIPRAVAIHVRTVQTNASPGSHYQESPLNATHVHVAEMALLELLEWSYRDEAASASPGLAPASEPTARPRGRGRRVRWILAGAGVLLLVALAVIAWPGTRTPDPAAAPPPLALRQPEAGLRALEKYRGPRGSEISSLDSASFWEGVAEDFARAAEQPGAPARWRAARLLAEGQALVVRGDFEQATARLREAVAAEPGWSVPHVALAGALSGAGQVDPAIAEAREAQLLEPGWWGAVAAEGRALARARRLPEAMQAFRRALEAAPREPVLLAELALVYHAARLDSEAVRYAGEALAVDPDMVAARVLLAERALEGGDGTTALAEATRAVAVAPYSFSACLAHADALALAGQAEEATAAYRRTLELWDSTAKRGEQTERVAAIRAALARGGLPPTRMEMNRPSRQPVRSASCDPNDPLCGIQ